MSWWVARAERTLSEDVPAPPEDVRDFYVDLDNIKRVHPLIPPQVPRGAADARLAAGIDHGYADDQRGARRDLETAARALARQLVVGPGREV